MPVYKRNFLVSIIARVDFPYPVEGLKSQLPPLVVKKAKELFPVFEPTKAIARELQISSASDEVQQKLSEVTEWRFFSQNRDSSLVIIPTSLFIEYKTYKSFDVLKNVFSEVLSVFLENIDISVSRFGLRYINHIALDDSPPLEWRGLLNDNLLYLFDLYENKDVISRVFHNLELNFGDYSLRYQFGMHNPDYPAAITKKIFILDFDSYSQSIQDLGDVMSNLTKFHDQIESLFELSITDTLRGLMNE